MKKIRCMLYRRAKVDSTLANLEYFTKGRRVNFEQEGRQEDT